MNIAKCYFPDGAVTKPADEFVKKIKADSEGTEISWTFDYAYSVDFSVSG